MPKVKLSKTDMKVLEVLVTSRHRKLMQEWDRWNDGDHADITSYLDAELVMMEDVVDSLGFGPL